MEKGPQLIIACAPSASAAWCLRQSSCGLQLQPCVVRFSHQAGKQNQVLCLSPKARWVRMINFQPLCDSSLRAGSLSTGSFLSDVWASGGGGWWWLLIHESQFPVLGEGRSGGVEHVPLPPFESGFPQAFPFGRGVALNSEPSPLSWLGWGCRGTPAPMVLRAGSKPLMGGSCPAIEGGRFCLLLWGTWR